MNGEFSVFSWVAVAIIIAIAVAAAAICWVLTTDDDYVRWGPWGYGTEAQKKDARLKAVLASQKAWSLAQGIITRAMRK